MDSRTWSSPRRFCQFGPVSFKGDRGCPIGKACLPRRTRKLRDLQSAMVPFWTLPIRTPRRPSVAVSSVSAGLAQTQPQDTAPRTQADCRDPDHGRGDHRRKQEWLLLHGEGGPNRRCVWARQYAVAQRSNRGQITMMFLKSAPFATCRTPSARSP